MLLDLAYRARRLVLHVTGWRTRGVRVMVFDDEGRVLLVRHGYGATRTWYVPGGGIRRRETPDAAARREVREETGCTIGELSAVGAFSSTAEGWRDTVHLFTGVTGDAPRADGWEVAQAQFFAPDALPAPLSPAVARRLAERAGASRSAEW